MGRDPSGVGRPVSRRRWLASAWLVAALLAAALLWPALSPARAPAASREPAAAAESALPVAPRVAAPATATIPPTPLPPPPVTPTLLAAVAPATATAAPSLTATATRNSVDAATIEAILKALTLEQKAAQMVMVGLPGRSLDDVAQRRILQQGFSGVILLPRNLESEAQLQALTTALQQAALARTPAIPLFIAWNHEGGDIVREQVGVTHFPSSMALGSGGDPLLARAIGQAVGAEMAHLGVNMNYAPVLDVNIEHANPVIGLRSFGENPQLVARLGVAYIEGLQSSGIIAVAKHFPGHGRTDLDSHLQLPTISASLAELWQVELPPFDAAARAGVDAVMVAHLRIPALDPSGEPSSLSAPVVTSLLRQQLGFSGVVMTDDLGMGAISNQHDVGEASVRAVAAGNDLLLAVEPVQAPDRIVAALVAAVRSGRLTEETIDGAVRRVLQLKLRRELIPAERPAVDRQAHQQLALQAGEMAVRVFRDSAGWLPLPVPADTLVLVSPTTIDPGQLRGDNRSALAEYLGAQGVTVQEFFYDPAVTGSAREVASAARAALTEAGAGIVVVWDSALRYHQRGDTAQEELVSSLLSTGKPVIVASGHLPYDDERLTAAPALVNLYGDGEGQLAALAGLLLAGWP